MKQQKQQKLSRIIAAATLTLIVGGVILAVLYLALSFRSANKVQSAFVPEQNNNLLGSNFSSTNKPIGAVNQVFADFIQSQPEAKEPVQEPASSRVEKNRLLIPSLGVDANIQFVGTTASGNMATPSGANKYKDVAWYKKGAYPGEVGNAVIAGHLDNGYGLAAVFSKLDQLEPGDIVKVINRQGKEVSFKVVEKEYFPYNSAPSERVFGSSEKAQLNLITCDGDWISQENQYNKRLVVYTTML